MGPMGTATDTSAATLLVGTRKGVFLLSRDGDSEWELSDPMFLGHIAHHVVHDPRTGRTVLARAHRAPRANGHWSDDLGATWTEATKPAGVPHRRPAGPQPQRGVLADAGARRRARRLVRGRIAAGPVPQRRRRRHLEAGRRLERPPDVGDVGRVARAEHARRLDAALGDRRPPRLRAPLPRALRRGRVRVDRRRLGLGAAQRRVPADVRPGDRTPSSATTRTACGCTRPRPIGSTSRTTAASIAWTAPRAGGCASATTCPREVGDIGFPIELHPRDPDTAWVFPMDGTDVWPRTSPDGRPAAYVTRDGGATWTRLDEGLPERAWFTVKRQAMTVDDAPTGRRLLRHHVRRDVDPHRRGGRVDRSRPPAGDLLARGGDLSVKVRIPTPLRSYTATEGRGRGRWGDGRRAPRRPRPPVPRACGSGSSTSRAGFAST